MYPTFRPFTPAFASKTTARDAQSGSPTSLPEITFSNSIVSSTPLAIGPSLSRDQDNDIAPVLGTCPYVGRRPVTPHRMLGPMMLPPVSLPMANPTSPATTAAPGPALDPDDPSSSSHGFIVCP